MTEDKSRSPSSSLNMNCNLTWEKLSPEEFQQLQDFAACKWKNDDVTTSRLLARTLLFLFEILKLSKQNPSLAAKTSVSNYHYLVKRCTFK